MWSATSHTANKSGDGSAEDAVGGAIQPERRRGRSPDRESGYFMASRDSVCRRGAGEVGWINHLQRQSRFDPRMLKPCKRRRSLSVAIETSPKQSRAVGRFADECDRAEARFRAREGARRLNSSCSAHRGSRFPVDGVRLDSVGVSSASPGDSKSPRLVWVSSNSTRCSDAVWTTVSKGSVQWLRRWDSCATAACRPREESADPDGHKSR